MAGEGSWIPELNDQRELEFQCVVGAVDWFNQVCDVLVYVIPT